VSTPEDTSGTWPSTAAEALAAADAVGRRIRSRRRWYVVGALVMAATLTAFTVALASWPDRLAQVIVPGLVGVLAILALLAWCGRTLPTGTVAATNRALFLGAALLVVTLLLDRLLLPDGFSGWSVLAGVLPGLPFLWLARRVTRA
jgi:hypothetical protein